MTEFRVDGDQALAASLHRVAGELDEMQTAGIAGGQAVKQRAQAAAPVRTGALARSVRADATGDTITVGAYVEYARFQEFGTVHVPASPYLRPALEASQTQIVNAYTGEIEKLLNTVKGA